MRVKLNGAFEIGHRGVAILGVDRPEDETPKIVAAPKVLFPGFGVVGRALTQLFGLEIGQFKPQALKDPLSDGVLQHQYVAALGINSVAPENVAGRNIEQLRGDTQLFTRADESGRQHGMNTKFPAGVTRIDILALKFCDHRTWPHDDRADLSEFGYNRVRECKLIKTGGRIAAEILKRQDRDALFLAARGRHRNIGCKRRKTGQRGRHANGTFRAGAALDPVPRTLYRTAVSVCRSKCIARHHLRAG